MDMTKQKLHEELNKACDDILSICLLLDIKFTYNEIKGVRDYISRTIDYSDYPTV